MDSIEDMRRIAPEEALQMTKDAKGSTWYEDWRPYCAQQQVPCNSRLNRMDKTDYGFRCRFCGNVIGFHLKRLKESPLNDAKYVAPSQIKKYY